MQRPHDKAVGLIGLSMLYRWDCRDFSVYYNRDIPLANLGLRLGGKSGGG